MPICHDRKLAFCHVPRTGGVSIATALKLTVNDYHNPASYYREKYPDYFLFATYRPYNDRIHSAMHYYVEDTFRSEKLKKRKDVITRENSYFLDCPVDYLLQFIDLEKDLNKMLKILNLSPIKLPHLDNCKEWG